MPSPSVGYVLLLVLISLVPLAAADLPLPEKVPWAVPDVQQHQNPDATRLRGWIGHRLEGNEKVRLLNIDIDRRLLDAYRNRPGKQTWAGEHVGKWLHAATLAWVNSGDPALREKLDFVSAELIKCQLDDGYLGTYLPERRWESWDVWSHKYNLIGLITYARHTGNLEALAACRRMADLLCISFGEGPGQRDITKSGWHAGMASSGILEPMVLMYRLTGDPRYLEFCHHIIRAWEQPDGPKIISTLLTDKQVNEVGNAKAYEMLSCLNGVLELYRTTGDPQLLEACLNAWNDIQENRSYITGTASYRELFRDAHDLPNTNNVGETCVTVTLLQFNAQLLRLTGEARFAQEMERIVLNQLIASQSPDCDGWGYYVQLKGRKPFATAINGHCCLSSGPRGLAIIPTFATSTDADGVVVNLYETGLSRVALRDQRLVELQMETGYPADGRIRITVTPEATDDASSESFAVKLRIPTWSADAPISINGETQSVTAGTDGYVALRRAWQAGDVIELDLALEPRVQLGTHSNKGKAAFLYGPLVLAADDAFLPSEMNHGLRPLVIPETNPESAGFTVEPASGRALTWPGAQVFRIQAGERQTTGDETNIVSREVRLRPFAEAGGSGSNYKIWLPLASAADPNVAIEARATHSRGDNAEARPADSIVDGELLSRADTSSAAANEHWFATTFARPVAVRRVTFVHGGSMTDNGWFDSSAGKPVVQIQREVDGPWETVGELSDYPVTTVTDGSPFAQEEIPSLEVSTAYIQKLAASRSFTLTLPDPQTAVAVRVAGEPSRANQDPYSVSCAELQVFVR